VLGGVGRTTSRDGRTSMCAATPEGIQGDVQGEGRICAPFLSFSGLVLFL
jgi:hypothetical protein